MKKCPSCGYVSSMDDCDFCEKCGAMYPGAKIAPPAEASLPSDPLERGFALFQANVFADGCLAWIEAFRDGGAVDDATYRRMVTECTGCMMRIVMSREEFARARVPDLAVLLDDRELITDLMSELVANRTVCTVQTGVLGMMSEYMLLFIDCFSVYTDLRDLKSICDSSSSDIETFFEVSDKLPAPQGMGPDWGSRWVENYRDFIYHVRDALMSTMDTLSEEDMDFLGEYWASKEALVYKNHLLNGLMMNIQLFKSRKFTGKVFVRGRDLEISETFRKYVAPKKM